MHMRYDIALVGDEGGITLHTASCPMVRTLAAAGIPVATLFQCESLPPELKRHGCMREVEDGAQS
jgi:hypothetical protein